MRTEIIAVGSELLTPFFQDTNSLFLTERLNDLGLGVSFKTLVGDDERDLLRAVRTALGRARLVIVMGGLGPTEDDRTRESVAKVLGRGLVLEPAILATIRKRFRRRGLPMTASNRKQALVIDGADVLENPNGTAPGLWVETPHHRMALLPGPPHELKPMFDNLVMPRLVALRRGLTLRRLLRLTGLGESMMESLIRDLYPKVPSDISVTTLASPGDLSIHLTYQGPGPATKASAALDRVQDAFTRRLGKWVYSADGRSLEAVVGALLSRRWKTVACAESCTGGLLGHRLTNIPGSSGYFLESAVVYANGAKSRRLGVPPALIEKHGAVSAPVARAMASGIRGTAAADYGLAVTGIAGPGGGSGRKPVGLVYAALAGPRGVSVERNLFWGGREQVKFLASQRALDMLRKELIKDAEKKVQ